MPFRRFLLMLAILVAFTSVQAQEERPSSRRTDDTVPLEKLPANQGMIVVTPDLRKALDALGAGSVVLSAEKYQELMKAQEKSKPDKSESEILFARCLLSGEVKTQAGREFAELTVELEFRTETPNASVPVPCKGMRMMSASINGQSPVWGPDPDRWTVLLKEPQLYRLKIVGMVPVSRSGAEKKLQLERLPASAITSLELKIPGPASNALIVGYGSVSVAASVNNISTLSAPALGVLSSLEMTWQTNETPVAALPPSIEGDVRVTLSESTATTEARLKPVPFSPIQLPWRVRVPNGSQQLRAELLRSESQSSEPLIATKQQDGTYLINSPYPLAPVGFTQVLLRWQQSLPDTDAIETVSLGSCQVLEPVGKAANGLITVVQMEQPTVLLRPVNVQQDKDLLDQAREPRRSLRYRYIQQPAGVEAVALPAAQVRGVVEATVSTTITGQLQDWQLVTEINVVRSNRSNLSQLELYWPGTWPINRRLLFSPVVKDIEQDTKADKLKIMLDGKQPGQFQLRLESSFSENPTTLQLRLPQLLAVTGGSQSRVMPLELFLSSEQVVLEAAGVDLQTTSIGAGLREVTTTTSKDVKQFQVRQHPANVTIRKQPRLPKYSSSMELAVGHDTLQSKQRFVWRAGTLPRQLQVLVPVTVRNVQFYGCKGEQSQQSPLSASLRTEEVDATWKRYIVELPASIEDCKSLLCCVEQESKHPLMVPLARLDEASALHEGAIPIQVNLDAGLELKLPAESGGWKAESVQPGRMLLNGSDLQSFLILDRVEKAVPLQPAVVRSSEERITPLRDGYQIESNIDIVDLEQSRWLGSIAAPLDDVQIIGWKIDGQIMPRNMLSLQAEGNATRVVALLPLDRLHSSFRLTVAWSYKHSKWSWMSHLPGLRWDCARESMTPHRWLVSCEPSQWLGWASAEVSPWTYPHSMWKPIGLCVDGNGAGRSMELVDSMDSPGLRYLVLPRYLTLLLGSSVGFLVVMQLKGRRIAFVVWALVVLLAALYWFSLPTATMLLWSVLPGLALALVVQFLRLRVRTQATVPVFQKSTSRPSTVLANRSPGPGSSLAASVSDAPTIMANPH
jgi:hypothetical protein